MYKRFAQLILVAVLFLNQVAFANMGEPPVMEQGLRAIEVAVFKFVSSERTHADRKLFLETISTLFPKAERNHAIAVAYNANLRNDQNDSNIKLDKAILDVVMKNYIELRKAQAQKIASEYKANPQVAQMELYLVVSHMNELIEATKNLLANTKETQPQEKETGGWTVWALLTGILGLLMTAVLVAVGTFFIGTIGLAPVGLLLQYTAWVLGTMSVGVLVFNGAGEKSSKDAAKVTGPEREIVKQLHDEYQKLLQIYSMYLQNAKP